MSRSFQRHQGVHFTTEQVPGAFPNGTRVEKVAGEPSDAHGMGDLATVIGSMGPVALDGRMVYGYFVNWDDAPKLPVFVAGFKIARVKVT